MIGMDQLGEVFVEMMPDPSRIAGMSDNAIDDKMRHVLAECGFDVDSLYSIGNSIWMMAAQSGQEPEATVVGAFITGCAMTALLAKKGAIR